MRKKLKFALTILFAICTLTFTAYACSSNTGSDQPHTHDYATLKYDSENHWYECSCGDKKDVESHSGGTATETEKAVCSVCNNPYGQVLNHTHDYATLKYDSVNHWFECECGKTTNLISHVINNHGCFCGYACPSDSVTLKYDSENHWYECICGEKRGTLLAHEYETLKYDSENHWYECSCGAKKDVESHSGGTATCTTLATCKDCSQQYGSLAEHTYSREWVITETHHYQQSTCDCNVKKDYGPHSPDDSGFCTCDLPISATKGLIIEKSTDGTFAEVVGYNGTSEKINIPSTYDNLPVKTIYNSAFKDALKIIRVVIPDSVISIGEYAFYGCASLKSIEIPNSVTSIGERAFEGCRSLTSIEIPNSVASIGYRAFYVCVNLKYNEEGSLKYLGNKDNPYLYLADTSSSMFGSVNIAKNCRFIGTAAFSYCSSLTSIEIPDSVTSIGDYAFEGCSSLTSIEIPNSVTSIGERAFEGCKSLTSIELPNSVASIGYRAFYVCYNLETVTFGTNSKLEKIEGRAFGECSSLTSIEIPNSVTSIGDNAFLYCSSLTSIEIPNSVTSIGDCAFYGCVNLKTVTFGTNSKLEKIEYYAFYNCDSLTSIKIPNGVTSIGDSAFDDCDSLTSIEIPDSVTSISDNAFYDCVNLKYNEEGSLKYLGNKDNPYLYLAGTSNNMLSSANIAKNCRLIRGFVFSGFASLTSIEIPNSVTSIGDGAFWGCDSLTSIIVSEDNQNYKSIDGNLYTKDGTTLIQYAIGKKATEFVVPNSVTSIGDTAFYNCSSLTSIEIPNGITSIGEHAFSYCSSLTSIEIPNSVTSIGGEAFYGCVNLKTVTFGTNSKLEKIERYAFYGCCSLTSIEIPNSVTSIGWHAFDGCSNLTSIEIPNSVTSIGDYAFYNCDSLTSIKIPNSVTSIGYGAVSYCGSLTIYCEAESKPSGWSSSWNPDDRPVVWGYVVE